MGKTKYFFDKTIRLRNIIEMESARRDNCSMKSQDNFALEVKLNSYNLQLEYTGRELVDGNEENQKLKCQIENAKTTGLEIQRKYETVQKELEKERRRIKDIQGLSKQSEGHRPEIQSA